MLLCYWFQNLQEFKTCFASSNTIVCVSNGKFLSLSGLTYHFCEVCPLQKKTLQPLEPLHGYETVIPMNLENLMLTCVLIEEQKLLIQWLQYCLKNKNQEQEIKGEQW